MANRPPSKPHLVGAGANQVELWGATTVLQTYFTGISARAIELPELINYQRKSHTVRKYPGDSGFNRAGGVVSRYDRSPAKYGGAKPGQRVFVAKTDASGKAIRDTRRTFRLKGAFVDLCEWAKDNAKFDMILYSSTGSPYSIALES
jgi:hypothetical protein